MTETICSEEVKALDAKTEPREPRGSVGISPVLARLIEEVRIEGTAGPQAYNRMHNRHNRSR